MNSFKKCKFILNNNEKTIIELLNDFIVRLNLILQILVIIYSKLQDMDNLL